MQRIFGNKITQINFQMRKELLNIYLLKQLNMFSDNFQDIYKLFTGFLKDAFTVYKLHR